MVWMAVLQGEELSSAALVQVLPDKTTVVQGEALGLPNCALLIKGLSKEEFDETQLRT